MLKNVKCYNPLLQHSAFFIYIKIDISFGVNPGVIEVLNRKLQSADMAAQPISLRPLGKHVVALGYVSTMTINEYRIFT